LPELIRNAGATRDRVPGPTLAALSGPDPNGRRQRTFAAIVIADFPALKLAGSRIVEHAERVLTHSKLGTSLRRPRHRLQARGALNRSAARTRTLCPAY